MAPTYWDKAIDRVATRIRAIQRAHGRDAVAVFGGGSLTNEKAYLLGKFARVALGTANIDYNGRFCMSSAAAAACARSASTAGCRFRSRYRGGRVILLVGGNPAETMPPIMQLLRRAAAAGGRLIVADPRRTPTAARHAAPAIVPGTDAALANGLLHVLIDEA